MLTPVNTVARSPWTKCKSTNTLSAILLAILLLSSIVMLVSSPTFSTFSLSNRLGTYSKAAPWAGQDIYEPPEHIVYVQEGPLAVYQAICLAFARYTHPRATIHLIRTAISDHDSPDHPGVKWEALLESIDVKVSDAKEDSASHLSLKENYKHSSMNNIGYELFCFMRWPTLYEYMKQHQIERALVMDADVFAFTNIFKQHPDPDWSSHEKGIYMQIFTRERIGAFVLYMTSFYNRPVHMVCDQLELMGSSEWSDSRVWALPRTQRQNIKCPGKKPIQFSDMYLFVHFQKDYKLTPVAESHALTTNFNQRWRSASQDVCDSTLAFRSHIEHLSKQLNTSSLEMKQGDEETSFVHLQGSCKKMVCPAFCSQVRSEHARLISCCKQ